MSDIKVNGTSITILITILLACISGSYILGKSDREDVIANLKTTIEGYQKVESLDLQSTLKNISHMSDKLVMNVEERKKLNYLENELKLSKEKLSTETSKLGNILSQKTNSIKSLKIQNATLQTAYDDLLPLVKEKLNIVRDAKYSNRSTIELIKDEFYIGVESFSSRYVFLNINGESSNISIGETKEYKHSGISCYLRLKQLDSIVDEAIFDYGCNI